MNLTTIVKQDIEAWLNAHSEILANERDLQVCLALALREKGLYDKVHLEYRIPMTLLKDKLMKKGILAKNSETNNPKFPWLNSAYYFIDIVVEKDGEFVPIELKYATRSINNPYLIFGEDPAESSLSDKATNDIIMYHYWKDVRRLEILSKLFKNVAGGISLLIANPKVYFEEPRLQTGYRQFSTHEGNKVGAGLLDWEGKIGEYVRNNYPVFFLDGCYACHWEKMPIKATRNGKEEMFKYLLTDI